MEKSPWDGKNIHQGLYIKACTKCEHISDKYNKREKKCEKYEYKINRNILIKNIREIIRRKSNKKPTILARKSVSNYSKL